MDDRTVICWDKDDIDALGILKVDILALGMLTCIRKAFDLIAAESHDEHVDDGRIDLHFQPIHRVDDGRLVGAELLARWDDPVLGRVPPDQFVQVAERSGLIRRLGELLSDLDPAGAC